jgi:hypothetical protein
MDPCPSKRRRRNATSSAATPRTLAIQRHAPASARATAIITARGPKRSDARPTRTSGREASSVPTMYSPESRVFEMSSASTSGSWNAAIRYVCPGDEHTVASRHTTSAARCWDGESDIEGRRGYRRARAARSPRQGFLTRRRAGRGSRASHAARRASSRARAP